MAKRSTAGTGADQARSHSDLPKRTSSPELAGCSASRAAATLQFSGFPLERPTGQAVGCGSRCTWAPVASSRPTHPRRRRPGDPADAGARFRTSRPTGRRYVLPGQLPLDDDSKGSRARTSARCCRNAVTRPRPAKQFGVTVHRVAGQDASLETPGRRIGRPAANAARIAAKLAPPWSRSSVAKTSSSSSASSISLAKFWWSG